MLEKLVKKKKEKKLWKHKSSNHVSGINVGYQSEFSVATTYEYIYISFRYQQIIISNNGMKLEWPSPSLDFWDAGNAFAWPQQTIHVAELKHFEKTSVSKKERGSHKGGKQLFYETHVDPCDFSGQVRPLIL